MPGSSWSVRVLQGSPACVPSGSRALVTTGCACRRVASQTAPSSGILIRSGYVECS